MSDNANGFAQFRDLIMPPLRRTPAGWCPDIGDMSSDFASVQLRFRQPTSDLA